MEEISEVITKAANEFKGLFDSLCTHCGECCKGQAIFLTDVEAPFIAKYLKELGGKSLVRNHLSINSIVFDKWHKYVLQFAERCPFLINERCSIYNERPLTCQLYPMSIIGFIDNPLSDIREVYLEMMEPLESHACHQSYRDLTKFWKRTLKGKQKHADQILRFLTSTLVGKKGFGYLFGQEPKKGIEAVMVDSSNPSAREVEMAIWNYYERTFKDQHSEIELDYPDAINDDDIDSLTAEMARIKANRTTSERIERIKKSRPHLMTFYTEFI